MLLRAYYNANYGSFSTDYNIHGRHAKIGSYDKYNRICICEFYASHSNIFYSYDEFDENYRKTVLKETWLKRVKDSLLDRKENR